jgi:hypothetical protein
MDDYWIRKYQKYLEPFEGIHTFVLRLFGHHQSLGSVLDHRLAQS